MQMNKRTFLFQINVTRDCNLRCTHCYISSDKKAQSEFMTVDQIKEIFRQIADFLRKDSERPGGGEYNKAEIHIIGGEPTMLDKSFYEESLPYIRSELKDIPGKEVALGLVTNLLTPQALEIASMFDQVSTSYEFKTRFVSVKSKKEKPALEAQWVENVKKLKTMECDVGVTMAVTKFAIEKGGRGVLDYFYDLGFKNVHLGFFIPSGDGLIYMDSVFPMFEDTSEFMIQAADWYLEKRDKDHELYINPVESMIESIYHDKPLDDIVCPIIPGSLDVDWDGETVTCIEAGGEVDMESLGNVFSMGIHKILESKAYRKERMKAIVPKPYCSGCDELQACQSACGVLHQYWNGQGECPGFKRFIKYIRHQVEVNGVKPKSVIQRSLAIEKMRGC